MSGTIPKQQKKKSKGLVGIPVSHNRNTLSMPRGYCYSYKGLKKEARLAGRDSIFYLTSLYRLI